MAPERFRGSSDPRSDVYGLGLTLYEMVALRPAFTAGDRIELIARVTSEAPPKLRKLDPHVPRDLVTIIAKATDKEPARRYQTAAELGDDLRRFLEDRPIRARQTGPVERGWRWCRRNPAVTLLLAALVAGSLAAAAVFRGQRDDLAEQAGQLEQDKVRLAAARDRAETALWRSGHAQSRALRWSGLGGRRDAALSALTAVVDIQPSVRPNEWAAILGRHLSPEEAARLTPALVLRNEAVACMALPDLHVARQWQGLDKPEIEEPIDFSPDLAFYARAEADGSVCVRRVSDDQVVHDLPTVGKSGGRPIRFSPDGRWLAVKRETDRGSEFLVWDLTGPATDRPPTLRGPTRSDHETLDFSPDGRWLAVDAPDGSIGIYNLTTHAEWKRLRSDRSPYPFVRFHPRSEQLAVACRYDSAVQVWDLKTGTVIRELPHPRNVVSEAAWSPDGRLLAVACEHPDNRVHVWDVEAGKLLGALEGHKGGVWQVAFHPHTDLLVSFGWDGKTRLWDFRWGRELLAVDGAFIRFGRDGRHLAFRNGRQVGLWEVTTADECRPLHWHDPKELPVHSSAFSPDGRLLAAGSGDGVRLWDPATGRLVAAMRELGDTDTVAFDPRSGDLVTCTRRGVYLWPVRAPSGQSAGSYRIGPPEVIPVPTQAAPLGLTLSQDGNVLAVRLDGWQTAVIHRREGKRFVLNAYGVVSPDGRWVMTGNPAGAGRATVWDSWTGERVTDLPGGGSYLTFTPDTQWLVLGNGAESRFYRVGSWQPRPAADLPAGLGPWLASTRDGQVMAVGSANSSLVRLVKAGTGEELATLEITPSPSKITGLPTFSPDGSQLVIHYGHEGVRVWDLRKVRARLAGMRLDWGLPPYPAVGDLSHEPLRVEVAGQPFWGDLARGLRAFGDRLAVANLDPGREHRRRSREHLDAGRWKEALEESGQALALDAADAAAWVLRGHARYKLQQYELAVCDLTRALALAPGDAEAFHHRGHCHDSLGRYREAVGDFTAALGKSRDAHLLAWRGVNYRRLGEYEQAVADLDQALESNLTDADRAAAGNALAWILANGPDKLRDPVRARPLAERAVGLYPRAFGYATTLGMVYYRLGQYEKARDTFRDAARLRESPSPADNLLYLAMAHHRLGETADARKCHDQALAWLKARPELAGPLRQHLDALRAEAEALLNAR
jgi:WD40 repeat protein/tetratricopeptide (TPR) repeat protein